MKVLILAEHDNQTSSANNLKVVSAASQLADDITVLVAGYHCMGVAEQLALVSGVKQVVIADHAAYQHQLAENISALLQGFAQDFQYILAPASTFGKDILPRTAALLDVGQISDITGIVDKETFVRPIYAGNALATIESSDPVKVITIRTTAFNCAQQSEIPAVVTSIDITIEAKHTRFIRHELSESSRPSLSSARVVVSGGRGLQSAENFKLLETLADKLGAAIGASRAAVDAGFVPNDFQVGQTGKVVAPELYIAIGISGAIQHLAGMKDSKVIVAINKDPDAPIFNIADYGLVGDLFEILPELEAQLSQQ